MYFRCYGIKLFQSLLNYAIPMPIVKKDKKVFNKDFAKR